MLKWAIAFLFAAASVAPAQQETKKDSKQDTKKAGQEKAAFEKHVFPFEGEVTTENLFVRMLPKADNSSAVASILKMGDKVTVTGESGDFFQILPVKGCTAWIFGQNLKKEGTEGLVLVKDSPVRTDCRSNADKLCLLNEGDKVKIIAEHLGWFKIESPSAVKYFVGKKYVKLIGEAKATGTGAAKKAPAATNATAEADTEALAKIHEADTIVDEMNKKTTAEQFETVDYTTAVQLYEQAATLAKTDRVKKDAESRAKFYRELQAVVIRIRQGTDNIKHQIDKLKAEEEKLRKLKEEKVFAFTGYVDTTSFATPNRPGAHKLVSATGAGGRIVCFLKAKDGDEAMVKKFNNLYKEFVGVNGTIVKDPPGWEGYSVVIVDDIQRVEVKK